MLLPCWFGLFGELLLEFLVKVLGSLLWDLGRRRQRRCLVDVGDWLVPLGLGGNLLWSWRRLARLGALIIALLCAEIYSLCFEVKELLLSHELL